MQLWAKCCSNTCSPFPPQYLHVYCLLPQIQLNFTHSFLLPCTSRAIVAELLPATLVAVRVYVPSSLYSTAEMFKVRRSEEKLSSTVSVEVAPLVLLKVQTMLFGSTRGMSSEMVNCRVTGLPCTPMRSGVTVDTTGTAERKERREKGRKQMKNCIGNESNFESLSQ